MAACLSPRSAGCSCGRRRLLRLRAPQAPAACRLAVWPAHAQGSTPALAALQVLANASLADYCINPSVNLVHMLGGHEMGHCECHACQGPAGRAGLPGCCARACRRPRRRARTRLPSPPPPPAAASSLCLSQRLMLLFTARTCSHLQPVLEHRMELDGPRGAARAGGGARRPHRPAAAAAAAGPRPGGRGGCWA